MILLLVNIFKEQYNPSPPMKKIEAVIRPEKLSVVRRSLASAGYPGMMITKIEGHGLQKGITQEWKGEEYHIDILPKVKVEIVAGDSEVDNIVESIIEAAYTGTVGDGKIFVYDIKECIRIRTRERGQLALT